MYYYPQQQYSNNYCYNANPNGQILPLGFGGYNNYNNGYNNMGGYYTGYYNNFNPYLAQQQAQAQAIAQKESAMNTADIYKKLFKGSCYYSNSQATQDQLNCIDQMCGLDTYNDNRVDNLTAQQQSEYYNIARHQQQLQRKQQQVMCFNGTPDTQNSMTIQIQNNINALYAAKANMPEDIGLNEYLKTYGRQDYIDSLKYMNGAQAQNILSTKNLYNSADYNNILNQHKNSLFGNILNPNVNIDDQEIRLPNYISDEQRKQRRQAFLASILN